MPEPMDGITDAMRERAAIVAYLRAQIEQGNAAGLAAKQGSRRERDLAAGVVVLTNATANIEAGEHDFPAIERLRLGPVREKG